MNGSKPFLYMSKLSADWAGCLMPPHQSKGSYPSMSRTIWNSPLHLTNITDPLTHAPPPVQEIYFGNWFGPLFGAHFNVVPKPPLYFLGGFYLCSRMPRQTGIKLLIIGLNETVSHWLRSRHLCMCAGSLLCMQSLWGYLFKRERNWRNKEKMAAEIKRDEATGGRKLGYRRHLAKMNCIIKKK